MFVNPYSGTIQGEIEKEKRFGEVFKKIHSELFVAGTIGNRLVELAACWAVILLISGLYLWWPRKRKSIWGILLPRFRKKGVTFWRDLHAVPAFWLSAFILILIATGLPWSGVLGEQIKKISTAPPYAYHWQEKPESIIRTRDVADNIPWANEDLVVPTSTPNKHLRLSIEDVAYVADMNSVEKPYTLSFPAGKTGVYISERQGLFFLSCSQAVSSCH